MHIEFVEGAGEQGRKETEELLRGLYPRAEIRLSAGGITFAVPDGSAADLAPRLECGRFVKKVFIPMGKGTESYIEALRFLAEKIRG